MATQSRHVDGDFSCNSYEAATQSLHVDGDFSCNSYQATRLTHIDVRGDVMINSLTVYESDKHAKNCCTLAKDFAVIKQMVIQNNDMLKLLTKNKGRSWQQEKDQEHQESASQADVLPIEAANEDIHNVSATPLTDTSRLRTQIQIFDVANSGLTGLCNKVASDPWNFDLYDIMKDLDINNPTISTSKPQFVDDSEANSSGASHPGLTAPDASNPVEVPLMTNVSTIDDCDAAPVSNQNATPFPEQSVCNEYAWADFNKIMMQKDAFDPTCTSKQQFVDISEANSSGASHPRLTAPDASNPVEVPLMMNVSTINDCDASHVLNQNATPFPEQSRCNEERWADFNEVMQKDAFDPTTFPSKPKFVDNFVATPFSAANPPELMPPVGSNPVEDQLMTNVPTNNGYDAPLVSNRNAPPVPEQLRNNEQLWASNIYVNNGTNPMMMPGNVNEIQKCIHSDFSQTVRVEKDDKLQVLQPYVSYAIKPNNHKVFQNNSKQRQETYSITEMEIDTSTGPTVPSESSSASQESISQVDNNPQEIGVSDIVEMSIIDDPGSSCYIKQNKRVKYYFCQKQRHETFKKSGAAIQNQCKRLQIKTGCRVSYKAEYHTVSGSLMKYQYGDLEGVSKIEAVTRLRDKR